ASTARIATLVVSGQLDTAAPAVALMRGVLQTMFLKKLKLAVVAVLVVAGLGVGVAYQGGASARAQAPTRPMSELERLRRENELLKLNLEVVLEKVRSLDSENRSLKAQASAGAKKRFDLRVERFRAVDDLLKLREDKGAEEALRKAAQD